ncbi:MAG: ComEC/Rec2 family competence protein [Chloroflexota bacterium]|nr:ComEC/Rec2 family competence protein [Chloroflexota bacterium]
MRLVYFVLAWSAGILLAANTSNHTPLVWAFVALLAMAALFFVWRLPARRFWHGLILMLTLGGLRYSLSPGSSALAIYNGHGGVTVEGVVRDNPEPRSDRLRYQLEVDQITTNGQTHSVSGVVLVETPNFTPVQYGDRVRATGEMWLPQQFDTFSYADYLARSAVFSQMPYAATEIISSGQASPVFNTIYGLQTGARANINAALPEPYAGLLTGMLLGDERGIAPEVEDAFAKTGAAHVIAISGYNMAVITAIVLAILKHTQLSRQWQAIIAIVIVLAFTVFVGASASVQRAAVMSIVVIIGEHLIRRKTFVPATLAFAALVLTLENPTALFDVGFQLSFFATLSIVLFSNPLTRAMQRWLNRLFSERTAMTIGDVLASTLVVSLASQILTLPLIALYFERISLVSLLVNVLIVPVQPPILIIGALATVISSIIPLMGQVLYWTAMVPLAWTTGVVRLFAALPFAEITAQFHPNFVALFFIIILGRAMVQAAQPDWLFSAARFVRQRIVWLTAVLVSIGLLGMIAALLASRPDGRLHIWLLTMGHSHAVLAQTPGGAHILVDGGRFPSSLLLALGDRLPFTDREIELLVLTQPDEFDYGGLPDVLARYRAGVVVTNGQPNLSPYYTRLQESWGNSPVQVVEAGYSIDISDGTRLEILHPQTQPALNDSLDDYALVLRLSYGGASFLISGDASGAAQAEMLDEGLVTHATALILPQHGTAGSLRDDFLTTVAPQFVLLQSDPANRRRDPDPDTLLRVEHLPLYRTDLGGTIHLWTDGTTIWLEQAGE